MGLAITAYSRMRHVDSDEAIFVYPGDFDRMDGRPQGAYMPTTDADVWWRAEHAQELPESERAATDQRVAALRAGLRPECPGDLAVLADARPISEEVKFDAGPYSVFGGWRGQLCRFVHGVDPEALWADPDRWLGEAFAELIIFSDAEGAIGPVTSAKLARDFAFYELHVLSCAQEIVFDDVRDFFVDTYELWASAFAVAAQDGFLIFH